jgi:uncharacterized protein YbjQ (UPF0145 family)
MAFNKKAVYNDKFEIVGYVDDPEADRREQEAWASIADMEERARNNRAAAEQQRLAKEQPEPAAPAQPATWEVLPGAPELGDIGLHTITTVAGPYNILGRTWGTADGILGGPVTMGTVINTAERWMADSARKWGASMVIGVTYETALGGNGSRFTVVAFGTAIKFPAPSSPAPGSA